MSHAPRRDILSQAIIFEIFALSLIAGVLVYMVFVVRPSSGRVAGVTSQIGPTISVTPVPTPVSRPVALNPQPQPELTAKSVFVWDPVSNTVLYAKNPDLRLPPASTTKLMTSWVALHAYQPDLVVTVNGADRTVGQTASLVAGEQLTVESLIKAMLINSGNDAALALGQAHPQGYSYFVELMNEAAVSLGLNNTHFTNVSGLEDPNHYSSAYDLSHLAENVIQNDLINRLVQTKNDTITDISGRYVHPLENTNKLLWANNGVNGIKTGWTTEAGECLITRTVRPEFPLIITVLDSKDRFGETQKLIDWAYQNYHLSSN